MFTMNSITCYDKDSHTNLESQFNVFKAQKSIMSIKSPHLPKYESISAKLLPVEVIQEDLSQWKTLRHFINNSANGVLSERYVSAAIYETLKALSCIHNQGVIHCNLDQDSVVARMMPFHGDAFKLVNFENARMIGSKVHPVF